MLTSSVPSESHAVLPELSNLSRYRTPYSTAQHDRRRMTTSRASEQLFSPSLPLG